MLHAKSGDCIGNYRLLHKIGTGGMGVVFAAEHVLLGRRAALKFLRPEVSTDAHVVERFFTEARAASSVRHPGIVEIYDFGYHEGVAYLVMEHLEGESLRSCLKVEGRLPPARAALIAMQIASALEAAHSSGVVHRDLKPDNVFLARGLPDPARVTGAFPLGEQRVCILDFGVAKLLRGDGGWSPSITTSDIVVGTPTFMSPEQCRGGGAVDGRSDLYSLGCILYAMLCGRPPFLAAGGGEVLAQHIYQPPAPPSQYAELPPELERIVLRLLEKEPDARYQTARDAARALRAVAIGAGADPAAVGASGPIQTAAPGAPVDASSGRLPAAPGAAPPPGPPPPEAMPPGAPPPGVAPAPPGARRSRAPLVAIAGVLVAAGIGTAVALATGDGGGEEATAPAAARAVAAPRGPAGPAEAAGAPQPEPPPAAPGGPALVELVIESEPSGADVHRAGDGQRLGRTPYRVRQEPREGYAAFELRLKGYEPEQVSLRTDANAQAKATLRPRRRRGAGGAIKTAR